MWLLKNERAQPQKGEPAALDPGHCSRGSELKGLHFIFDDTADSVDTGLMTDVISHLGFPDP